MNTQHNVSITGGGGYLHAEWADRALDDDDRYTNPDTIFIRVRVPVERGHKALMLELHKAYDKWMEERT